MRWPLLTRRYQRDATPECRSNVHATHSACTAMKDSERNLHNYTQRITTSCWNCNSNTNKHETLNKNTQKLLLDCFRILRRHHTRVLDCACCYPHASTVPFDSRQSTPSSNTLCRESCFDDAVVDSTSTRTLRPQGSCNRTVLHFRTEVNNKSSSVEREVAIIEF